MDIHCIGHQLALIAKNAYKHFEIGNKIDKALNKLAKLLKKSNKLRFEMDKIQKRIYFNTFSYFKIAQTR